MEKEIGWLLKEKYHGEATLKFYKDIERLKAGEPVDYVIGFTEFLGCKIDLSKKPLILRAETEFWVEEAINQIGLIPFIDGRQKNVLRVLDMFAGSGCIGLAILRHVKNADVTFADKYKYFNHPRFVKSDIFSNIPYKYDYIFSNPPYVATRLKHKVQKSALEYEPKTALFGGKDGMDIIKKFLKQAKSYLNADGKIFMEFSPEQKKDIEKIIKQNKYSSFEFHKDQYNRWRWVSIV